MWALTPFVCYQVFNHANLFKELVCQFVFVITETDTTPTDRAPPRAACQLDDTHWAVVDLLPLIPEASHVTAQTFETLHLIQAATFIPRLLGEPGAGIRVGVVQAHTACQKEAPLPLIHLQYDINYCHAAIEVLTQRRMNQNL